jgi:hypothetical protein
MQFGMGWGGTTLYVTCEHTIGKISLTSKYVPDLAFQVGREVLKTNLIVMTIEDYDLILGMDWLSMHSARMDYNNKVVHFVRPGRDVMEFKGNRINELKFLIAGTKTWKMLAKRCQGYFAYLFKKSKDQCTLEDTAVVKEFQDVFSAELTLLPPPREIEFTVDLIPEVEPVSRTPYRMTPTELQELKEQLKELLQ